ncbi:MAG: hypothetical protein ACRD2N_17885 [Vicinamibacterales bacterium]
MTRALRIAVFGSVLALAFTSAWVWARQAAPAAGQASRQQFPGGTNPDGSLRPSRPLTNLFTQDAYTLYEILAPGSEQFRITFMTENNRAGATEIVNATRAGSEGTDVEVFDPRTGKPMTFVYEELPNGDHAIRAALPFPVPEGGIGRALIYKTYKDARTYMMNGSDIVWVRSLSGYRLGVVLPKGFGFVSSDVAAHVSTLADGRLKLAFANPSGQSNPVTIHARPTTAVFKPAAHTDVFLDDIKTLYDLGAPESGAFRVEQTYSETRKGPTASIDALSYLPMRDLMVIDLDTAKPLDIQKSGTKTSAKLGVPITSDKQSAHLSVGGTVTDGSYRVVDNELVFERTLRGLRNTVLLPSGWQVSMVSQSGTIGRMPEGRAFVALINLNAENIYKVVIRARARS